MDSLSGWHVCLNYFSCWLPSAHITYSPRTHWNHLFILNLGHFSPHSVHHVYTKMPFSCFESWGGRNRSKDNGKIRKSRMNQRRWLPCRVQSWGRIDSLCGDAEKSVEITGSLQPSAFHNTHHPNMWNFSVPIPELHNAVHRALNQVNLRLPICTEHLRNGT